MRVCCDKTLVYFLIAILFSAAYKVLQSATLFRTKAKNARSENETERRVMSMAVCLCGHPGGYRPVAARSAHATGLAHAGSVPPGERRGRARAGTRGVTWAVTRAMVRGVTRAAARAVERVRGACVQILSPVNR